MPMARSFMSNGMHTCECCPITSPFIFTKRSQSGTIVVLRNSPSRRFRRHWHMPSSIPAFCNLIETAQGNVGAINLFFSLSEFLIQSHSLVVRRYEQIQNLLTIRRDEVFLSAEIKLHSHLE